MKTTARTLLVAAVFALAFTAQAKAANLEWLGIVSGMGGAERETGLPSSGGLGKAGGRGTIQALGVIPFGPFGAQASFQYTGGSGSRIGTTFGPLYDFTAGKVGLFATYQYRSLRSTNFWWIEPALDWYLDQVNLNLRYIQPVSSPQRNASGDPKDVNYVDMAVNRLQATASYFPPDFLSIGKDNLELTFGAQVNSFVGPRVNGAGVGPVFGIAMAPMQNVEFTVIKGTVDNRSRFELQSGIRLFIGGKAGISTSPASSQSLKDLRRKYMEASPYPVSSYTAPHCNNGRSCNNVP
jgi:hypothetical protein